MIPVIDEHGFDKIRKELTRMEEHYFEMLTDYKEHKEGKLARSRNWYQAHYRGLLKAYEALIKKIEKEGYVVYNQQMTCVKVYEKGKDDCLCR